MPIIGTVTGAVGGAVVGAASGFFRSVVYGMASELSLSYWSVPRLYKKMNETPDNITLTWLLEHRNDPIPGTGQLKPWTYPM